MLHSQQNALQNKDLQRALKVLDEHVGGADRNNWQFRHQSDVAVATATFLKLLIRDERAVFCCV